MKYIPPNIDKPEYTPSMLDVVVFQLLRNKVWLEDESFDLAPVDPSQALKEFLSRYPRNRIWQLAVDGVKYSIFGERGWSNYEKREPGSLQSFFRALHLVFDNFEHSDIDVVLIQSLHRAVSSGVQNINRKVIPGEFRPPDAQKANSAKFSLNTSNRGTPEGFARLLDKIESGALGSAEVDVKWFYSEQADYDYLRSIDYRFNKDTAAEFRKKAGLSDNLELAKAAMEMNNQFYYAPVGNDVPTLVDHTIEAYNANIKRAVTTDDKLQVIGETIESFEQIHPFGDANGRTFVNLLLNRLLLQNGFPPATFYEPNVYDTFGHHVDVLKRAIQNTIDVYHGKDLFNFRMHQEMTAQELKFFEMKELEPFAVIKPHNPLIGRLQVRSEALSMDELKDVLSKISDPVLQLNWLENAYEYILSTENFKPDSLTDHKKQDIHLLKQAYLHIIKSVPYIGRYDFPSDIRLKETNYLMRLCAEKASSNAAFPKLLDCKTQEMDGENTRERNIVKKLLVGIDRDISKFSTNRDRLQYVMVLIAHSDFTWAKQGKTYKVMFDDRWQSKTDKRLPASVGDLYVFLETMINKNPSITDVQYDEAVQWIYTQLNNENLKEPQPPQTLELRQNEQTMVGLFKKILNIVEPKEKKDSIEANEMSDKKDSEEERVSSESPHLGKSP